MVNERTAETHHNDNNGEGERGNGRRNQQDFETNPWNLQGFENPRASLVSTLLTADNYVDWSRAVKISLIAKEKLDFVIGPSNKPAANDPRFKKWKRCDSMVLAWLINSISKELAVVLVLYGSKGTLG